MTEFEVELRIPGAKDFSYAHIKYVLSSTDNLATVAAEAKAALDGVYSEKAAHDLVVSELGGQVISIEPANVTPDAPWSNPLAAAAPPWTPEIATAANVAAVFTPSAPVSDVYLIEVPRDKMDVWGGPKGPDGKAVAGAGVRGQVQAELAKRGFDRKTVDWDGVAKRNTIKRNAPDDLLNYIRSQGIELK